MGASTFGIMPNDGKPIDLIDRADWATELEASKADKLNLDGERVRIRLLVELPFWLLVPECEISLMHEQTSVQASVFQKYIEVSQGPLYHASHATVRHIAHANDLTPDSLPPCLAGMRPAIIRHMKTVIVFQPEALKEALDWSAGQSLTGSTPAEEIERVKRIRRINYAHLYFCSLAFGHIPFLNHLIRSYRSSSFDPFAVEISGWDVPIWFAQYGDALFRICLVPYWGTDTYPTVSRFGETTAQSYIAATGEAVQTQAQEEVTPGELELLNALSLYHRGRFDDAIRSAVTAIEVAVEAQLFDLLKAKHYTDEEADRRLAETRNSFHDRLKDYEKVSQRRLPSPMVSWLPTINGVRLKSELGWVRHLRHQIVHQGVGVDIFSAGLMQRAIETMTWLFRWLSGEKRTESQGRNFTFFNAAQGGIFAHIYPVAYSTTGVIVGRHNVDNTEADAFVSAGFSTDQYAAAISEYPCDVELFTKMSLVRLGIHVADAPPEVADDPLLRETYHISHAGRKSLVFCLEFDGLIDAATIGQVALRLLAHTRSCGSGWGGLCIVHHQRHAPWGVREIENAVSEDIDRVAAECGLSLVTTTDLCLLVQAGPLCKWNADQVRDILFSPGRQGITPPAYRRVGSYLRFYERPSVMSVQLDDGQAVRVGDTIGVRLATRYYEEQVKSLQLEHETVQTATGPRKVGIKTNLRRGDLGVGQAVFVRTQEQATTPAERGQRSEEDPAPGAMEND
jgi:hypothetical protein